MVGAKFTVTPDAAMGFKVSTFTDSVLGAIYVFFILLFFYGFLLLSFLDKSVSKQSAQQY